MKAVEESDVGDAAVRQLRIFEHFAAFIEPLFDQQTRTEVPSNAQQTIAGGVL